MPPPLSPETTAARARRVAAALRAGCTCRASIVAHTGLTRGRVEATLRKMIGARAVRSLRTANGDRRYSLPTP